MATLQRYDGTSVVHADSDLDSIIAHLVAANASGTGNGDDVFFMCSPPSLLIMDLNWQINRRFSELFQASTNMNQLFFLQFENDQDYYDLPDALAKCGYAGVLPQSAADLPSVYMALYESGLVGASKAINVGSGDSLVAFGGTITEPAQIKGLQAGPGVLLSDTGTDINIAAQPPTFSSLGAGTPILDYSSTPSHIYLNTLQAGAGISLAKTAGAVQISSTAILNSTGTGASLVQGTPGAIKSLLGAQGVVVTSATNTVTVGLGSTLTCAALQASGAALTLQASDGTPLLTVNPTTVDLRLNALFGEGGTALAHVLNSTDMVFSGKVNAQSVSVAQALTVGGDMLATNVTANASVFANAF